MQYRPEIDGLRAVAALAVVIFHLDKSLLPGGFLGVDIFFVISGFLISSIINRQVIAGEWSFKEFYIRRLRRLAPALLVVCFLTLIAASLIASPTRLQEIGRSGLFSALYVSNIDFWQQSGYFDVGAVYKPLLHTWSLSVEEQFYLVWPVLIFFVLKRSSRALLITFSSLFIISLCGALIYNKTDASAVFFLMPFRIYEFALGALLIFILPYFKGHGLKSDGLRIIGSILLFVPLFVMTGNESNLPFWSLIPCIGAVLIILAGTEGVTQSVYTNELSRFFGKISYSLYLVHWPLITLYFLATFSPLTLAWKITLFGASVGLGWLLYKYVETTFRHSKNKNKTAGSRSRSTIMIWGSATLAVAALGFVFIATKGLPKRLDKTQTLLIATANSKQISCPKSEERPFYRSCQTKLSTTGKTNIVLLGDSHAGASRTGFSNFADNKKLNGKIVYNMGTLPLLDVVPFRGTRPRTDWKNAAKAAIEIATEDKPDLVILIGRWSLPYHTTRPGFEAQRPGFLAKSTKVKPTIESSRQALSYGLETTLSHFQNNGIPVLIVGQVPHNGVDLRDCMLRPKLILGQNEENCSYFSAKEWASRTEPVDQLIREAIRKVGHGTFVSSTPFFCNNREVCLIAKDGKLLYFDDDHLSVHGANFLFSNLENEINRYVSSASSLKN